MRPWRKMILAMVWREGWRGETPTPPALVLVMSADPVLCPDSKLEVQCWANLILTTVFQEGTGEREHQVKWPGRWPAVRFSGLCRSLRWSLLLTELQPQKVFILEAAMAEWWPQVKAVQRPGTSQTGTQHIPGTHKSLLRGVFFSDLFYPVTTIRHQWVPATPVALQ